MTKLIPLNYHVIKVTGEDASDFLSGQLTSDVGNLKQDYAQLSARLNIKGKVKCFFHLGKVQGGHLIIISSKFSTDLKQDLEKYIIAEDVELNLISEQCSFIFDVGFSKFCKEQGAYVRTEFLGKAGCFIWDKDSTLKLDAEVLTDDTIKELFFKSGYPCTNDFTSEKHFINNLILNELAISYSKGCFLGQEPTAKIHNNRGGSHYPVAFEVNQNLGLEAESSVFTEERKIGEVIGFYEGENAFLSLSLLRDFRVEGRDYEFQIEDKKVKGKIKSFPLEGHFQMNSIVNERYLKSLNDYNTFNIVDDTILSLEDLYFLDPSNKDVCEALGAILGNCNRYKEAIKYMDDLETLDPDYGMANTNKSVYYMKLGDIETAEKEKESALLKSFKSFGKESDNKDIAEKRQKEEEEKRGKRKKMFLQVLELDSEDTVANYGLANILFIEKNLAEALTYVEKVVEKDKKYSVAYLLMGQILEKSNKSLEAKKVYEMGIVIASNNGDMQPANEMQQKLNKLTP